MNRTDTRALALSLMAEHGLTGWGFAFDRAVVRAGACHFSARNGNKITLSAPLTANWSETAVRDILLHEIAHALAGPNEGHGAKWWNIARSIGCTGRHCWTPSAESPDLPPAWIGVCPNGHVSKRGYHRRPTTRRSCSQCRPGRFDERYVLTYERNLQAA